jgi:hypothetical protein
MPCSTKRLAHQRSSPGPYGRCRRTSSRADSAVAARIRSTFVVNCSAADGHSSITRVSTGWPSALRSRRVAVRVGLSALGPPTARPAWVRRPQAGRSSSRTSTHRIGYPMASTPAGERERSFVLQPGYRIAMRLHNGVSPARCYTGPIKEVDQHGILLTLTHWAVDQTWGWDFFAPWSSIASALAIDNQHPRPMLNRLSKPRRHSRNAATACNDGLPRKPWLRPRWRAWVENVLKRVSHTRRTGPSGEAPGEPVPSGRAERI